MPTGQRRGISPGRLATALVALLLMAAVSACGPSAGPTIPTLRSPGASPSATISPEQAMRAYVACMRQGGIAMPDPLVRADGEVELRYPDQVDKQAFAAADGGCRQHLANAYPPPTTNPNAAAEQDALLAYARCMREHGIDMPDPIEGPASTSVLAGVGPEQANPSFTAADAACSHFLPGKPGSSASPQAGSSATPSGVGR